MFEVLNSPTAVEAQKDPLVVSIIFVAVCIAAAVGAATPLMGLYRTYKSTRAEGARSEAQQTAAEIEAQIFQQMQVTLAQHAEAIRALQADRDKWFAEAFELKHEVERLKVFEQQAASMKKRLEEKDKLIEERDKEIRELTRVILQMKDRIHALELRLARDENFFRGENAPASVT